MAKRVFATVKPEILVWARTSAGFTGEAAAAALKIEPGLLAAWETQAGDERPSVPQLRSMAALYKRPLAVFYLQEVPLRFQVLSDLRRPALGEDRTYSPQLTLEIRSAQQRRELALELRAELEEPVEPFPFRLAVENIEQAGEAVRLFLGLQPAHLQNLGGDATGRQAFNLWRVAIERSGVLVFQSSRVSQSEASGFALAYDTLPVVVVNRKDVPQRRLFSMLHEFVHVALRESGVSDLKLDLVQVQTPDIELLCNSIAAAALMPKDVILSELDLATDGRRQLSDDVILRVARRFGVSRPALLLRLIGQRQATWDFYFEKIAQYAAEHERELAARSPAKDMKRNMAQESLSNLGRPFVGLVLGNYFQRRITLSDVAGHLGIRVKHVEALQRRFVG
ncbi:MAG: ImmA/IrrE family metallo-endopeptidase [Rubrivivax sp.]|nr:ImmA/IrrE family metallo-endopeptidase [Rubrivivax sp.]